MRRHTCFLAAIAMAVTAGITFAQTTSGDLVGTVKDSSGAAIANATVTVTNEATGVAVSINAGAGGEFRAGNLLPGTYDLAVNSPGFQPYTLRGLTIELNKTSTENVTLSIGTTTTVEVTAEAGAALDTTTTNLSQVMGNQGTFRPSVHDIGRIDRVRCFERIAAESRGRLKRRYRHRHWTLYRRTTPSQQQFHH